MLYRVIFILVCLTFGPSLYSQHKLSKEKARKLHANVEYFNCYNAYQVFNYPIYNGASESDYIVGVKAIEDLSSTIYTVTKEYSRHRLMERKLKHNIDIDHSPWKVKTVQVVTDTVSEKRFEMKTFFSQAMKPLKDSVAILAQPNKINKPLIAESLKEKGYTVDDQNEWESNSLRQAIYEYQKDYNLCIGNISYEFLDHLYVADLIKSSQAVQSKTCFDEAEKKNHPGTQLNSMLDSLEILDSLMISNPSFEDTPRKGGKNSLNGIEGWLDCGLTQFKVESPPDNHPIQQMTWQVNRTAAHGATYLGMVVRDNDSWEALSQNIEKPMEKGNCYMFSAMLGRSEKYISLSRLTKERTNYSSPTVLRLWGADKFCNRMSLLSESERIVHSEWKEYVFSFEANYNYDYIVLEAYYQSASPIRYNGHILVDGMSHIYQIECQ